MRRLGINDLDLLEAVFEQLPNSPFFVKDKELRYCAANTAMAQLCGVKRPQNLYGRRASDFFPASLAQRYEMLDEQVLWGGSPMTNMLDRTMVARGEPAWLLFSRLPVRDGDGSIVGVVATSRRLKPQSGAQQIYDRIAAITERMRREFDEPLRLDELAQEAGVSKSQLERDFLRLFSMSPRAFLQQVRLERALQMLEATDHSIAQIAYECGYADHSAFTRRFQKIFGVHPRGYRAQYAATREKLRSPGLHQSG